jgi:hypothetical protein
MTNTNKKRKPMPESTITPTQIRHFIGDTEVASIPEMVARMSGNSAQKRRGDIVYNVLHSQRHTMLPKPEVYGTSYFYPIEPLREAVLKVKDSLANKSVEKNEDVQKLLSKISSNPELTKVLLGLLD